jgi:hypothetical protein
MQMRIISLPKTIHLRFPNMHLNIHVLFLAKLSALRGAVRSATMTNNKVYLIHKQVEASQDGRT